MAENPVLKEARRKGLITTTTNTTKKGAAQETAPASSYSNPVLREYYGEKTQERASNQQQVISRTREVATSTPSRNQESKDTTKRTSADAQYDINELNRQKSETKRRSLLRSELETDLDSAKQVSNFNQRIKALQNEREALEDAENQALIDSGEYRKATLKDLTLNSLKQGYYNSLYGKESYNAMQGWENEQQLYKELLEGDDYKFIADGVIPEAISGVANFLGQQGRQLTDPRSVAMGATAAGAAALAGQAGPQVLLPEEVVTVPTAFLGGLQVGSAMSNYEIEAGLSYNELLENGVSEGTAKIIAQAVGGANAALELLQMDELAKSFKILKANTATQGAASRIAQELARRAGSVAKETAQELAQEGSTIAGTQIGSKLDTGEWAYGADEVKDRLKDTAISSALSFGLMNVPGAIRNATPTAAQKGTGAQEQMFEGKFTPEAENAAEGPKTRNTEAAIQAAYEAGKANLPRERAVLDTAEQEEAYVAGRKGAILAMKEPVENDMASEYTGGNKTKEAVSDVYERGEDARVAGFDPGASPEIGDRSGVQEEIGGVGSGIQRSVRLDGPVQASRLIEDADSYGVPLELAKPESWPADQADHIAYSVGGKVYVREDFPADKEAELVPHEGTHIMRQKKFKPYMDLLERTADSMNLFSDAAQRLIAAAAKHRGIDVFGMTEDEYDILYDEVNAYVSAAVMSGKESVIADDLNSAFNDYAAYREELVSIHEQFKGSNKIDDGLGAANAGFAGEYDRLQRETDEFHPEGENPQRPVDLPVKDFDDRNISRTVRTVMEAGATPDEIVPKIEELVAKGEYSYDAYADETAIKDAARSIEKVGWAQSLADWTKAMERGEVSKKLTATGWALYNNAANSGDTETALTILDYTVKHQRNAAQALQATRILKKLSPETQLYQVQRSVESLQEELNERYGDEKAPELKIDPELAERYMKSKDQSERDEVMKDIYRDIGRQMPSRFIDKWNAWRYLAMLGNPRTHVRNVVGNAGFAPVVAAKNLTATAIESAVSRVSGGKLNRTKSLVGLSKNDRALMKAAWEDFAKIQDAAMSGGKYDDFANANQYIEEGRQIFKLKPLEAARKGNTKAMEKEDMWFSRPHYAAALAGYCKQHGLTPEQIAKGKETKNARAYAIKEAQKATYRDTNALSQTISELGRTRAGETNPVKKGVGVVMQGILPFRKTPANILARGLEYSPVGLMNGIKQAAWDVKRGKKTGAEAIDSISAGLTGTGLLAMGMYLAAQGLVRGHGDDDDKENDFKEMMGHQAYALEVGDTSVTLDWLAPEVLPLFIGVNLWEQTNGADEELTLSAMLNAAKTVTEPLLEMSCLQSLNDVFDSVGYAASEGLDGLPAALASAATSYLTQGLPTILGQAERSGEDVRMTTYTEKNAFLTGDMQYTLGRASARIPGWEYQQIPYIDAWGRTESSGGTGERAFNNFLNPAYTSEIQSSAMEEELLRLYEQTGEGKVLPSRAAKYFNVDGERKDLAAEEYVKYAQKKGQTAYTALSGLTQNSTYKAMDDTDKADAVSKVYEYANAVAKSSVSDFTADGWVAKAVSASKTTGIKPEQYVTLYIAQGRVESLKDSKGDTIDNSKGLQIMQMIYNTPGLTEKQRQQLFLDFGVGKTVRGYNKSLVEQKLKEMKAKAK